MQIDFEKIEKIYGEDTLIMLKENIEEVKKNMEYLIYLGFDDIEDIFERYTLMFIEDNRDFINKMNRLIRVLGDDYVNKLETNMEIWEQI